MLYKNEPTKRKNMFQGKNFFQGGLDFFQISGEIDQEVCVGGGGGGLDQHSSFGGIALCRGDKFFQGDGA